MYQYVLDSKSLDSFLSYANLISDLNRVTCAQMLTGWVGSESSLRE